MSKPIPNIAGYGDLLAPKEPCLLMVSPDERIEPGGDPPMHPHPDWTAPPKEGIPEGRRWCGRCATHTEVDSECSCGSKDI